MDYKSVIEEQIKNLQKFQENQVGAMRANECCLVARTILLLANDLRLKGLILESLDPKEKADQEKQVSDRQTEKPFTFDKSKWNDGSVYAPKEARKVKNNEFVQKENQLLDSLLDLALRLSDKENAEYNPSGIPAIVEAIKTLKMTEE
jgi:hypothetical protein